MAFDGQPRFSPDGTRVVFTSDRGGGEGIHIISLDKTDTVQVTRGKSSAYQSPEWTPDGNYVLATRQGPGQGKLWMYHVDGGSGIQIIDEPASRRTTGAAFGPDDRYIWYSYRNGGWEYNSGMRQYQLAVYDRETGESATRSFRYGGAFRPALSPDGRWLVYGSRHVADTGLRIRDLESGDERWLAFPVQRDDQESLATRDAYPGMSFTPDSREVVAFYGGGLWRIPIDGSEPTPIPFRVDVTLDIGPEVDFDYRIEDTGDVRRQAGPRRGPLPRAATASPSRCLSRVYVMEWPEGTPRPAHRSSTVNEAHARVVARRRGDRLRHLGRPGAGATSTGWTRSGGDPGTADHSARLLRPAGVGPRTGSASLPCAGPGASYDEALTRGVPGGAEDLVWIPADRGGGHRDRSGTLRRTSLHRPTRTGSTPTAFGEGLISFRWDGTDKKAARAG